MGHVKGQERFVLQLYSETLILTLINTASSSPINLLLKGGCNLRSVNVLSVESILHGFSNLKKH